MSDSASELIIKGLGLLIATLSVVSLYLLGRNRSLSLELRREKWNRDLESIRKDYVSDNIDDAVRESNEFFSRRNKGESGSGDSL